MNEIISELETISADTQRTFGELSSEQLNWKPNAESWGIGQCFEHLIVTNKLEMIAIEKALRGEHTKTVWERLPVLPKIFGSILIKAVNPESKKKFKAPKNFRPVLSNISRQILDDYVKTAQQIIGFIKACKDLDSKKMIITSPIPRIAYCLYDAFKVISLHDRRHFRQAKRVTEAEGFPT